MADDVYWIHRDDNRSVAPTKGGYESQIEIITVEINAGEPDWEGTHVQADKFPGWDHYAWNYDLDKFDSVERAEAFNALFLKEGRQTAMDWYGHNRLFFFSLPEALALSPVCEAYACSPDGKRSIAVAQQNNRVQVIAQNKRYRSSKDKKEIGHEYIHRYSWSATKLEEFPKLGSKGAYPEQMFLNMLPQCVWLPIGVKEAE